VRDGGDPNAPLSLFGQAPDGSVVEVLWAPSTSDIAPEDVDPGDLYVLFGLLDRYPGITDASQEVSKDRVVVRADRIDDTQRVRIVVHATDRFACALIYATPTSVDEATANANWDRMIDRLQVEV
jgi:hypothetical protein